MTRDDGRDRIDILAEEFSERCRRGERPSVSEYEARYPECAAQIRELLPSVALIEQLKRQKQRTRAAEAPSKTPERLGDFRIIREVGRGGMGIVYEAEQVSLGRRVALKVLPHHSHLDPKRLGRFQHEAQAAARLHHSNVVPVLGVGEHEGLHYYVMPFIEGRGLDQVRAEWKSGTDSASADTLPPHGFARSRAVARIGVQAAEALQYAHEQGVLHRDVKPANLLLDGHGVVWVADFGLAKLGGGEGLTHTGDIIGTLQYMAPEQFQGQADARSDVYGLGLTLYELLTLAPGFQDSNPSRLIQRVSEDQPPRPRKLNPAIPLDLETIVLKAIAREPSHRYATAGELADDLRRFLEDRPVRARRVSPVGRLWRWCRRNRTVAALSATAAAALVLAAVVGGVGYARTTAALANEELALARESKRRGEAEQATKRADENVALSLAAIADLLDKIAPREDRHPPPPPRDGPPGERFGFDPRGFGPPPGRRPPGPPGRGGPPGRQRESADQTRDEAELIQSILTFYDQFAARNATDAHVQRVAANAYLQVGELRRNLGQSDEAGIAFRRASALFEALLKNGPTDPDCRHELAEAYILAAEGIGALEDLAASEPGLRRALDLAEQIAAEVPFDAPEPADLIARARLRLAISQEQAGRLADAEASLRQAIAATGSPDRRGPSFLLFARFSARQALGDLVFRQDQRPDALALYRQCLDDLRALNNAEPLRRHLEQFRARQTERLADSLRDLNEPDLAAEAAASRLADRARPPRNPPPGPPGRRPPPP